MAAPLYDKLRTFCPDVRLFTPGHKGRLGGAFESVAAMDVTELADTDDLYCPTGVIAEAEAEAAKFFGSAYTFFSAGGATLCIQTALSCFAGRCVIMDRNSHISAFRAAATADIDLAFIQNAFLDVPQPVTASQVKAQCLAFPEAAAVYITSPNYYGLCADLEQIRSVCDLYNKKLIVDNAHGAHMYVTNPDSCAHRYADIVIDSAHKTLPVLTGGAYLHFYMPVSVPDVKERMRYFGSTSPSFLILASLDQCRQWLCTAARDFAETVARVQDLKRFFAARGICVLPGAYMDPLRITLCVNDGDGLAEYLRESGIYCEMSGQNTVVMLFSPFNDRLDFDRVRDFFAHVPFEFQYTPFIAEIPQTRYLRGADYRRAFFSEGRVVSVDFALDRVASRDIFPYPPGVPVLLAGERITCDRAAYLKRLGVKEVSVLD